VIAGIRRQRRVVPAVKADAVEMPEIRILALFAPLGGEPHDPVFSSRRTSCITGPSPVVTWFSACRCSDHKIDMTQSSRWEVPEEFVRRPEHLALDARFVLGGNLLFIDVRTAPVAASAIRSTACLWSRDVEMNASRLLSGLHCMSRG